jgi:uncharacterized protein
MKKKNINKAIVPFYFKKTDKKYLLTNDGGDHLFLQEEEFLKFLKDELPKDKEPYLSLQEKNFVDRQGCLDNLVEKYSLKHEFLFRGPSLHIVIATLRCNHQCLYCHASAQDISRKNLDMSKKTAEKVLDMIFKTTSPYVAIEFQGGEPLLNWPTIKLIIEEAQKRNKIADKNLELRLVSNFSLMTEERFEYLIGKKVSFCVSLDGPKNIHNKNRPLSGADSYDFAAKWIRRFNEIYAKVRERNYIYRIAGVVTVSKFSLPFYKEIVDEYVKLGFGNFYLRPLNPFGFTVKNWKKIGYSANEYINFYKKLMDYIIKLNLGGTRFKEKTAVTFLTKILTEGDPNHLDYRSPCGAGIGQLAYNYNGDVYTCDEGRMLSMMGDENFKLGTVYENNYKEIITNPVVRTMCTASCLEGLAGCSDCVFKPFCGVCPIYSYSKQGNIFGQMPNNDRCVINKAILNYLFEKLEDKKTGEILKEWVK